MATTSSDSVLPALAVAASLISSSKSQSECASRPHYGQASNGLAVSDNFSGSFSRSEDHSILLPSKDTKKMLAESVKKSKDAKEAKTG